VVGSHTIGATLLARQIGGKSRLTGLIVAGFYLVVLFAGLSLLAFFRVLWPVERCCSLACR
jgi:MFS superfamily sulfate permease-like transporter